jgi:hypothetical protein
MRRRISVAVGWGALMGGITFAVEPISSPAANPVIEAISAILMGLIFLGLIGGAVLSGNIHAYHLWPCALVNAFVHFCVSWALISLILRSRAKHSEQ